MCLHEALKNRVWVSSLSQSEGNNSGKEKIISFDLNILYVRYGGVN